MTSIKPRVRPYTSPLIKNPTYPTVFGNRIIELPWPEDKDWRDGSGYYKAVEPTCCVCGAHFRIGVEARFGYSVCEEHSKLSPVEVGEIRQSKK